MAGFYKHVTVSTALGIGYGAAAYLGFGIDWATCAIAGGLTGLAGMLPDLDSPTGQPVREVFGLASALVPVLLMKQLGVAVAASYKSLTGATAELTPQVMVVIIAACYFAVRFGGAWLLDRLTVHRGMFHSIPAAFIVAISAFMLFDVSNPLLRVFLAGGPFLGFLSHLIMDEIWSVKFGLGGVGLKKSAGTAFKLFSGSIPATIATYSILLGLCYMLLRDRTVSDMLHRSGAPSDVPHMAERLIERARR